MNKLRLLLPSEGALAEGALDLLGKNDAYIARSKSRGVFIPGHNKWDYEHSIGKLNPDVIVQISRATKEELRYLKRLGYIKVKNNLVTADEFVPAYFYKKIGVVRE